MAELELQLEELEADENKSAMVSLPRSDIEAMPATVLLPVDEAATPQLLCCPDHAASLSLFLPPLALPKIAA